MEKNTLAAIVRNGRTARSMTQQELADGTGISLRSIQRIENGEVVPRSYTVRVLCEYLGVSATAIPEVDVTIKTESAPQVAAITYPQQDNARKVILAAGVGVLLLLGGLAYIFQAERFPETTFEVMLFWMVITLVYMVFLLRLWSVKAG